MMAPASLPPTFRIDVPGDDRDAQPLDIVFVTVNYAPEQTGIGPYASRLTRGLVQRGHRVRVVTAFPHYPQWRVPEAYRGRWRSVESLDGASVTRVNHYVPSEPSLTRRALSEISFGLSSSLTDRRSADLVIAMSPAMFGTLTLRYAMGPRRWRQPALGVIVQDLYSSGVSETSGRDVIARTIGKLETKMLAGADGIAVIHERFRQRLVSENGISRQKVEVIPNWAQAPLDAGSAGGLTRRSLGWSIDETVVLHTGAMGRKQDLSNVVAAARLVEGRERIRFVLVGDGSERKEIESQAAGLSNLEVRDAVPREEYLDLLALADVLLVNEKPTLNETALPSKLTSYFAAGRPILACTGAASVTAEELRRAGAAHIVVPGAPAALVEGVQFLRDQPTIAATMASRAAKFGSAVLDEQTAIDAYEFWAQRLVQCRRRKGEEK